jgi:hypothetical protein
MAGEGCSGGLAGDIGHAVGENRRLHAYATAQVDPAARRDYLHSGKRFPSFGAAVPRRPSAQRAIGGAAETRLRSGALRAAPCGMTVVAADEFAAALPRPRRSSRVWLWSAGWRVRDGIGLRSEPGVPRVPPSLARAPGRAGPTQPTSGWRIANSKGRPATSRFYFATSQFAPSSPSLDSQSAAPSTSAMGAAISPRGDMPKHRVLPTTKGRHPCRRSTPSPMKSWRA